MIAQHLASNNPVGSRIIFLGMLNEVIENQHKGFLESCQIFIDHKIVTPTNYFKLFRKGLVTRYPRLNHMIILKYLF
jgi:hypothetical protein